MQKVLRSIILVFAVLFLIPEVIPVGLITLLAKGVKKCWWALMRVPRYFAGLR